MVINAFFVCLSISKLAKIDSQLGFKRSCMQDKDEILKATLKGCHKPLELIEDFLIKFSGLCRLLDKRFSSGDGFIGLRIISESLRSRMAGVNLDISGLSDLCSVSRDKIRRMSKNYRNKTQPYSARIMVDGRMVYDENASTSPETAIMFDKLIKLWKTPNNIYLKKDSASENNEVLKTFLKGCDEPLDEIYDFLFKFSEMARLIEKKLPGGDGFLFIRIASEGLRARVEGFNPDISALAELCSTSRDKIRRTMDNFRDKEMPYSEPEMIGRRKVYDEHASVSPVTAEILDEMVNIWQK